MREGLDPGNKSNLGSKALGRQASFLVLICDVSACLHKEPNTLQLPTACRQVHWCHSPIVLKIDIRAML